MSLIRLKGLRWRDPHRQAGSNRLRLSFTYLVEQPSVVRLWADLKGLEKKAKTPVSSPITMAVADDVGGGIIGGTAGGIAGVTATKPKKAPELIGFLMALKPCGGGAIDIQMDKEGNSRGNIAKC